jgi:hypothetical protein
MEQFFKKTLTPRDFLKYRSSELLNSDVKLTREERWQQAVFARSVRNFWFTASSAPPSGGTNSTEIIAQTPRFAEPLIVTDILSMYDFKSANVATSAMQSRYLLQMVRFGGEDASSGKNLLGLNGFVGAEFLTRYEKNRSQTTAAGAGATQVADAQSKYLPFVPRLLRPYDFIQAKWLPNPPLTSFVSGAGFESDAFTLQLGFRSVRVLNEDTPYKYIGTLAEKQIKDYIASSEPEMFLLEVNFPFASIPPLAAPVSLPFVVKTPQMGRPLLILGSVTNLEGCQGDLYAEDEYYRFSWLDGPLPPGLAVAFPTQVPLNLWAPNSDFRNTNSFFMWPVPHLLQPGAQLRMAISSGLIRFSGGFSLQITAKTRSSQQCRVTFLCRTV